MRILHFLLLLLVGLAGCSTGPHRAAEHSETPCKLAEPSGDPAQGQSLVWEQSNTSCSHNWAVRYSGAGAHGVNYVEIDEQGVLRNRVAAEDALRYARAPGRDARPVYLVVFIHGWHHDAAADDGNVQEFHTALRLVSLWHPDRDVRGVYIGWRGKAWGLPLVRYLTFWDRKSTSEEVGRGGLLEFLLRLEQAVKSKADPAGENNRLVLVGHSFGASVAFNALAHVFLERFLEGVRTPTQTKAKFRGYGDLVVLVNPAIEAMRYMPFQSALEYYRAHPDPMMRADFSNETVPRLVVLSSEGDWATRYAFPIARYPSTLLELHEKVSPTQSPDPMGRYSEWLMDGSTLGNFEPFYTHGRLEFAPDTIDTRTSRKPPEQCTGMTPMDVRERLSAASTGVLVFRDSQLQLAPRTGTQYVPYLLAAVDKAVVKDHTDIGEPHFICWLDQIAGAR